MSSRRMVGACLLALSLTAFSAGDDGVDELDLAAASLERGDEAAAVSHLERHLTMRPDQPLVRFSLAELLFRRDQFSAAKEQYERFLHDAPAATPAHRLIHVHFRLAELFERSGDSFAVHLHRGIGLYLMTIESCNESDRQEWLCKAAGQLNLATMDRAGESQPHWYLHLVWARLAQSQPAQRHLRQAITLAQHSSMTPSDRRDLAIAALELDNLR